MNPRQAVPILDGLLFSCPKTPLPAVRGTHKIRRAFGLFYRSPSPASRFRISPGVWAVQRGDSARRDCGV